jgi:predicted secreted protein
MKSFLRIAAIAFVVASTTLASVARADTPPPQGVLGLAASASVEVAKDVLSVTFSTAREGTDANSVQAQLKRALDAAFAEAKRVARPGELDVRTGNFSLYPRYASPTGAARAVISGWQGSTELVVEGRDMAAIGALTGRIATMTIADVSYGLSREASQKLESSLAAAAIAAFRAKAASYATLFGYTDYAVREVTVATSEPAPRPMPLMRMQASVSGAPPLSVEPGRAMVTATVNGTIQMR